MEHDGSLTSRQILQILPHRYPFVLIDKIIKIEKNKKITAIKNVTNNEEFFKGHFPGKPVMPGVLIVEAMAQTAAVMVLQSPEQQGKILYFAGIDKVKFLHQVCPGDQLRLEMNVILLRKNMGKMKGRAYVEDVLVAKGEVSYFLSEE
jgi:3-hydroxyacyl-[acyl-carrier-protein] dehydratase